MMRRTKIIATVGPASSTPASLDALIAAGVDVFRLNFSHGTHESHREVCRSIRDAARRGGRQVAVMQDLSGPKIRTGSIAGGGPLQLAEGQELRIAPGNGPGGDGRIFTPYAELLRSARPGDRLLLDDGRIELRVVETSPSELRTVVVTGGPLGQHKGINAPGVALPASAVTVFRSASTSTTRTPRRRRMSWRWYHASGLSVMSSGARSPARTDESRMRL